MSREHWQPHEEPEPSPRHYIQAEEELPLGASQDEIAARAWELMEEEAEEAWDAYRDHRANQHDNEGL